MENNKNLPELIASDFSMEVHLVCKSENSSYSSLRTTALVVTKIGNSVFMSVFIQCAPLKKKK
jgi:hypothetical protein